MRFNDNPLLGEHDWADTDIARSMERRALLKAHAAICPCDYMIREFKRAYATDIPIFRIPNWFDVETVRGIPRSSFREERGWGRDLPVVYIPSAGSELKGKRYVFEIIRRLSKLRDGNVRFFLSGGIPGDLKLELETAGLMEKVYATGPCAWSENLACVKACDVGVSPTLIENFSMAIIEAMAMGLPFVAFDTGGNREIITDGQSGWIVPYLDVDALVERALELVQNSGKRAEMSSAAASIMAALLAPDRMLALYEDLFAKVVQESRGTV
jgi:glycosyltransferase involved in cell wall biosynthesis